MGNPKNITSYDPRLIMMIEQIAETEEPVAIPFDLGTTNAATTFGSRFSTLKNLLVKQYQEQGKYALASQIAAVRLKQKAKGITPKGKEGTISWWMCNGPESRRRDPTAAATEAAFDALQKQLNNSNNQTSPTPPPSPHNPEEGESAINNYLSGDSK